MSSHCLFHRMNKKKLKLQVQSDGYDYFYSLPDELVMLIFTKLSTSTDEKVSLDNIKSLCRCSKVSKRFNALTCLVPTLVIRLPNIKALNYYCPIILQKFKHIRSLQVSYLSHPGIEKHKPLPIIRWQATYRPHAYCLALVSYKNSSHYFNNSQKHQSLMLSADSAMDVYYINSIRSHTLDLIGLHHMLVCLIKDHKYLQEVVVTDLYNRGMLTLKEDVLVELRNCTSTNPEQVLTRNLCRFAGNLDVPFVNPYAGVVMDNVCYNLVEWWEKPTDDHIHKDDDNNVDIPSALPFKCPDAEMLRKALTSMMENSEVLIRDGEIIVEILADLKSLGYLL